MSLIQRKPHANSPLANLSPIDQQRLVDWLGCRTYTDVRQLAAQPAPDGLGLKISHGALVRFHNRVRQQEVLAKLDASGATIAALVQSSAVDIATLNRSTRNLLQIKTLDALRDPDFSFSDKPHAAKMALKLWTLDLREQQ